MQLLFVVISKEGQKIVNIKHIAGIVVLLVVGYYVGVNYPGFWKSIGA